MLLTYLHMLTSYEVHVTRTVTILLTLTSVTCKLATEEYRAQKRFFPFILFSYQSLSNHFPLPRPWTRDRDFGPATATLDPRPRPWTRDRDLGPATATLDPRPRHWTRDPRPAIISQTPFKSRLDN